MMICEGDMEMKGDLKYRNEGWGYGNTERKDGLFRTNGVMEVLDCAERGRVKVKQDPASIAFNCDARSFRIKINIGSARRCK
jgi:hypothetical protein